AIIGVLAALRSPALSNANRQAQEIQSINNLRQHASGARAHPTPPGHNGFDFTPLQPGNPDIAWLWERTTQRVR
ncbi:MAG TPA: hypothetical protein DCY13_10960, partial [Verrucomicrobiales bacterium]|nr:hypothetical protein [Verrucomicrobiales bacterium]